MSEGTGLKAESYIGSLIGAREVNQDAWLAEAERLVFAVADGVGGGLRGEVASAMAISVIKEKVFKATDLRSSFNQAQAAIFKEAMEVHGEPIMGTTLTAGLIEGNFLYICHVGDSRCYCFREGQLILLTEDQDYYDDNLESSVLSSYLGIPTEEFVLKIFEEKFPLKSQDKLLFCTDGLHRQLEDPRIVEIMRGYASDSACIVKELSQQATASSQHSDNVTLVLVDLV